MEREIERKGSVGMWVLGSGAEGGKVERSRSNQFYHPHLFLMTADFFQGVC